MSCTKSYAVSVIIIIIIVIIFIVPYLTDKGEHTALYKINITLLSHLFPAQKSSWSGMMCGSMFKRPKANVLLTVVTPKSSVNHIKPESKASFPVDAVSGTAVLSSG